MTAFARGWRQLRSDLRRHLLTALAVIAGTALLGATLITNSSVGARLGAGIESLAGIADVGIVPAEHGGQVPDTAAGELSRMPGVSHVIPTLSEESTVRGPDHGAVLDLLITGYPSEQNS